MNGPTERISFEDNQAPRPLIDLGALQAEYPDPADAHVIQLCDIAAFKAFNDETLFDEVAAGIYGVDKPTISRKAVNRPQLATAIFIDTLTKGMAEAADIDQFDWRLRAFFAQEAHGREYLGETMNLRLSMDAKRRNLSMDNKTGMSMIQVVKFCEAHPEFEEAAINAWINGPGFAERIETTGISNPISDLILTNVEEQLVHGQDNAAQLRTKRLLDRLRSTAQWRRAEVSPWDSPRLSRFISSLELMPIDQVPEEEIKALHAQVTSKEFQPRVPAATINSAVKTAERFLKSLVRSELDRRSLTGIIVSKLEAHGEDDPLGYSDFTGIANKLTPVLQRQGLDVSDLDPRSLADFPKAVDRVLFVALAEKKSQLQQSGQLEKWELAADCIRRLAFKGVEGKLEQRVLSVGEIVMRYRHLPAKQQRRLIEERQRHGLSETAIEAAARRMGPIRDHQPKKPGWGVVS